jgi:hypothetical protein
MHIGFVNVTMTCLESYFTPTQAKLVAIKPPSTVMDEKSGMILAGAAGAAGPRPSIAVGGARSAGSSPAVTPSHGSLAPAAPPMAPPPPGPWCTSWLGYLHAIT